MKVVTELELLHKISEVVKPEELEELKQTLFQFLLSDTPGRAVGIAAIQLGIPKAAFAYWHKTDRTDKDEYILTFVANPTIEEYLSPMISSVEGCLSVPDIKCVVNRYSQLTVKYDGDLEGYERFVLTEDDAIVFQHEYDHTIGKLITDVGIIIPKDIKRNDLCVCGSKKKWKRCCGKDS